ncbi:MAG: diguanylate phosphodiesterase [Moraxellaceae bacterium]|jgi:EAL domain-containing protein (putative c-di-GMP-specific phosphodiesterase class I)|nr:diguanylate phosphodiesterase [Moraxellaceae bacterium]
MTSIASQFSLSSLFTSNGAIGRSVDAVLHVARTHLNMDVAFVAQFRDDDTRLLQHVDSRPGTSLISAGQVIPLKDGYCQKIIDGRLPELMPDTSKVPAAMALPETRAIPIGSHVSVPIRLSNGRIYGTFCCFSFRPDHTLSERDLALMHTLAGLVATQLEREMEGSHQREASCQRISAALAQGQPAMVYQPIVRLNESWDMCGVECLARFRVEPRRPPDQWFAEAAAAGMGLELEVAAIRRALTELHSLPGTFYVTLNASPETACSPEFAEALEIMPIERLVLEITEHARVKDYAVLKQGLAPLRNRGMQLAIDDAGAGYSSLQHIVSLQPDFIKLDASLVRNIHTDPTRRALAAALLEFGRQTESTIIAEGVETAGELSALHALGVSKAQGYLMSLPLTLPELRAMLESQPPRQGRPSPR